MRTKWIPGSTDREKLEWWQFRSLCGRFLISSHPGKSFYLSLIDTITKTEYTCRTIDSAKTAAREILSGNTSRIGQPLTRELYL